MSRTATLIATLFGIGRFPVAPGTIASLVALPFAWLILRDFGPLALAGAALAATIIGIWATDRYARETRREDPSECVIDELVGQWFACALVPLTLAGFLLAFALFRFFDITKLWPISRAERLAGGLGIMADDVVAGVLAAILVAVFHRIGLV